VVSLSTPENTDTVGGHKSKRWAVLHQNAQVALPDFEGIAVGDLRQLWEILLDLQNKHFYLLRILHFIPFQAIK